MQETSRIANPITHIDLTLQQLHNPIIIKHNKHNPNITRLPRNNPKNNQQQDPRQHNRIFSK